MGITGYKGFFGDLDLDLLGIKFAIDSSSGLKFKVDVEMVVKALKRDKGFEEN